MYLGFGKYDCVSLYLGLGCVSSYLGLGLIVFHCIWV